jgi:hypothetical protein
MVSSKIILSEYACSISQIKTDNWEHHGQMGCQGSHRGLFLPGEDSFIRSTCSNMEHIGKIQIYALISSSDLMKVPLALCGTNNGWHVWADLYQVQQLPKTLMLYSCNIPNMHCVDLGEMQRIWPT